MVVERIPSESAKLVDIGCGDGRGTSLIKDAHPEIKVVGVDYSERALQLAKTMSGPRDIEWLKFNVYEGLNDLTATFDVATCIEMLEHLPPEKLSTALRNIHGLLVSNGFLILTVPSTLAAKPLKHYQHFTIASIGNALEEAGFRVIRCDGQERADHWLFSFYRFADNRWWTFKPLMHWMNSVLYPRSVASCMPIVANRLVVVAQVKET